METEASVNPSEGTITFPQKTVLCNNINLLQNFYFILIKRRCCRLGKFIALRFQEIKSTG